MAGGFLVFAAAVAGFFFCWGGLERGDGGGRDGASILWTGRFGVFRFISLPFGLSCVQEVMWFVRDGDGDVGVRYGFR